jgi:hypothetical protein
MVASDMTGPISMTVRIVAMMAMTVVLIMFVILGNPRAMDVFVTSDTLLPAHMAWDLHHHAYAWANFQWPRVPSLPDLLFFGAMELFGINWRISLAIYTCLMAIILTVLTALVANRIRQASFHSTLFWTSSAFNVALLISAIGLQSSGPAGEAWYVALIPIVCVTHGNALLLSLAAYWQAFDAIQGDQKRAAATWTICAVGTFSDGLFYIYFLIPMLSVVGFAFIRSHFGSCAGPSGVLALKPGIARDVLLRTIIACGVGTVAQGFLFRQGFSGMKLRGIAMNVADMANDIVSIPWITVSFVLLIVASIMTVRRIFQMGWRLDERSAVSLCGLLPSLLGLALLGMLYVDPMSYRYALPFLWWPVIFAIGFLPQTSLMKAQLVAILLIAIAILCLPLSAPKLLRWKSPIDQCIQENVRALQLEAGLATFWWSRSLMASRDWTIQVDQITGDGTIYVWGNNREAYRRDIRDSAAPAPYNFILIDPTIATQSILAKFGSPNRVASCHDLSIWKYDRRLTPSL